MKKIFFFRTGSLLLILVLSFLTAGAQLGVTTSTGLFTPQSLLHVHDNNTSGQVFQLTNATSGNDAATKGFSISFGSGFSTIIRNQHNNTAAGFSFWTNDGTDRERLTINNNGRIGIGTSNPQYLLHIAGSSNVTQLAIQGSSSQTNLYPLLILRKSDGTRLLDLNSDDFRNVFLGTYSGQANTPGAGPGQNNTFLGYMTGFNNSTGYSHTFTGSQSGSGNTTGNYNTGYGMQTLFTNSTGSFNTAIGCSALAGATGNSNTAIGYNSGGLISTGYENVLIGQNADVTSGVFYNSIAIGTQAKADASNQVRFGNGSISTFFCQGAYSASTSSSPNMFVNSSGQIMRSTATLLSGTGIAGQVAYWSGVSTLTSNANLFWDVSNARLGIGTASPGQKLSVEGTLGLLESGASPQYHTILQAGDQAGDLNLIFPVTAGSSGQVLSTNGGGTLSWTSAEYPITFSNGLNRTGNTAKLGGSLSENTTITQSAAQTLTFTNSGTGNTMINLTSAGDFQIQDNGTAFLTATDGGNIGIGTTGPSQKLSVGGTFGIIEGGAAPTYYTIFQGGDQSASVSYTLPIADGTSGQMLSTNGAGTLSWTSPESPLTFTNGLTRTLNTVKLGGALTENTTVTQSGTESLTFSNGATSNTAVNLTSTGDFQIQDNGTAFFTATDAGKIGIGTSAPNEQLELTGNLRLPSTTSALGIIYFGASPFAHVFGAGNTFVGRTSGNLTLTGTLNTGIGTNALFALTNGIENTAVGWGSLTSNTGGSDNVAVGYRSLETNTSGHNNIAIGASALQANLTGTDNIAIGFNALDGLTSGTGNVVIGNSTANILTNETDNTVIGNSASVPVGCSNSVAIGSGTIANASNQVRLGNSSISSLYCWGAFNASSANAPNLYVSNSGQIMRSTSTIGTVTGSGTATRIAFWSGSSSLSSHPNLFWDNTNFRLGVGTITPTQSLDVHGNIAFSETGYIYVGAERFIHSLGTANTFLGRVSGNTSSTGDYNTGIGYSVLYNHSTGANNTGVGAYALNANSSGSDNTAVGYNSLAGNTGSSNTALGASSFMANISGERNTAVGGSAGNANTTGSYNTFVGYASGPFSSGYTNSTALGYSAHSNGSNEIMIGNGVVSWIGGAVDWSVWSDGRFKRNIKPDVPGLSFIMKLHPVSYNWDIRGLNSFMHKNTSMKQEMDCLEKGIQIKESIRYSGFIAQEVEETALSLQYDFSGVCSPKDQNGIYSLRYAEFVVPLVKAVQEQQETIQLLASEVETLKKDREMLLERLDRLEGRINK